MTQRRWGGREALFAAVGLSVLVLAGCAAALEANRRAPGSLVNGSFQPARPAADHVGPDAARTCPRNAALDLVQQDLGAQARPGGHAAPQVDGRLCAVAETLLGWEEGNPPQSVLRFLASYFGLENPHPRVNLASFDTEDARKIADSLRETMLAAAGGKVPLRFGISTNRVKRGLTKAVLVIQDAPLELDPVPRKLAPGAKAQLTGRLVEPFSNPKVGVSDPAGRVTSPKLAAGKAFQAELACGDKPGLINVEIRGEQDGAERILASFPVACGTDLPASVEVAQAAAGAGPADAAGAERGLLDQVNNERKAAGLPALSWDDAVAKVARSLAEQYRDSAAQGASLKADVAGMLREAGVTSSVALVNPAEATSPAEAQAGFVASPTNRGNLLNREATHAGVGVASGKQKDGRTLAFVVEVFVKELGEVVTAESLKKLRAAIAQKRAEAKVPALAADPVLDKVAQQYAAALAAGSGNVDKATDTKLIKPLYRSYSRLNVLAGAKADAMDFTEAEGVRAPGKVIGVGLAQGSNAVLGKNALYGVILIGERSGKPKR